MSLEGGMMCTDYRYGATDRTRVRTGFLKDLERVSFSLVEGSFRTDAFVTGEGQRKERHNVLG